MSYKDLLRSSKLITRVRLLDSDWKVARLTAAVEVWPTESIPILLAKNPLKVPWIEGFLADKFRFTLEKNGSVIIVLSQLDRRYFNGLDDNYKFRLKFRISQPDTEDLLIESRPCHRHERSVAIEIDLEAGNYNVDLGITALKNPNARSLSDIVQEIPDTSARRSLPLPFHMTWPIPKRTVGWTSKKSAINARSRSRRSDSTERLGWLPQRTTVMHIQDIPHEWLRLARKPKVGIQSVRCVCVCMSETTTVSIFVSSPRNRRLEAVMG